MESSSSIVVPTIHNGIMYWVRIALISIFCIHSEYFRALEEKQIDSFYTYVIHVVIYVCDKRWTYRNGDFVDITKIRSSYEGGRHVLGINYINCYGGCGGQHLVLPLELSTSILRKWVITQEAGLH